MTEADIERIVKEKAIKGYGIDPLTILAIISAAIKLYQIIKACKQTQNFLKSSARRKGLAYKIFVRNNFLNKLRDLNVSDEVAQEILEELRQEFIKE